MRQTMYEGSPHMESPVQSQPAVRELLAIAAVRTDADLAGEEGERRWQERANCLGVDPDLFFPERGASTREAKAVCGSCEVRAECLEYALDHAEKFGIWGGLSERERRRLRRQRALARRNAASA
jgi:WhiB family transcriptional regulator, redox-sensing transcriptional regulator